MTIDKEWIHEHLEEIDLYDIEGSLQDFVTRLLSIYNKHKDAHEKITIEFDRGYDPGDETITITGARRVTQEDKDEAERAKKASKEYDIRRALLSLEACMTREEIIKYLEEKKHGKT